MKEHTISALFPGAGKPLLSFNTPDCCLVIASSHARPYPYISCSLSQTLHYTTGEESPPYVQHMLITENKALFVLYNSFTLSALFGLCTQLAFFSPFVRCLAVSLQEHRTMCHCFTETKRKELKRLEKKVEKIWKQTE